MGKDADHAGTALYFPVEPFNMIECPAEPPESRGKAITVVVLPHFYPGKSGFSGSLPAAREEAVPFFPWDFFFLLWNISVSLPPGAQPGTSRALTWAALAVRKGKEPVSGRFLNLST